MAKEPANSMSIVDVIIGEVANEHDIEPTEVSPPMFEAVDGDALENFYGSAEQGKVEFQWANCDVAIEWSNDEFDVEVTLLSLPEQVEEASNEQDLAEGD